MSNLRYDFKSGGIFVGKSFRLKYISRSVYEGEWHSTPHIHQCTEIFYVVNGYGNFKIQDTVFEVGPNEMVIVNPQVEHTELGEEKTPLEYIVLGIEGSGLIMQNSTETRYTTFKLGGKGKEILRYLNEMLEEIEQKKVFSGEAVQSLLMLLLIKLMRIKPLASPPEIIHKSSRKCASIKRYMDSNYGENITLDSLAELSHISKYYLAHAFTREYGVSPINYLLELRIKESRHLLANTDYSIAQISQILGFSSPSYFSQRFRRFEGVSPKAYRSENSKK